MLPNIDEAEVKRQKNWPGSKLPRAGSQSSPTDTGTPWDVPDHGQGAMPGAEQCPGVGTELTHTQGQAEGHGDFYPGRTVAVTADGEQGPAGNLPRKCLLGRDTWGFLLGPRFWGADANITPPRALLLCISHPSGAAEAGEGRTKAQPRPASFVTLSACHTLCQVIFTPSKLQAEWCAVKNTIKLNYPGARNFPPPHLSSFLHLIPERRKITQRSIRKGEKKPIKPRAVPARLLHFPQPISLELCPSAQVISDKIK